MHYNKFNDVKKVGEVMEENKSKANKTKEIKTKDSTANRTLYLMISRTDGKMGRFIRYFTNYNYNHVSLTLDPKLRSWVSFARYHCDVALYGGYICESAERFLAKGGEVPVRIFRVELSEEKYRSLEGLFAQAGDVHSGMIYNTFDALATSMGCNIPISNAYTCLGFACMVLGRNFRSIKKLDEYLSPNLVFEGDLRLLICDSGSRDDIYFTRMGALHGTCAVVKQLARLSARAVRM